jgi:hypothetical protein
MELRIKIELGNDAFKEDRLFEVTRILQDLIERLPRTGETAGPLNLHDYNGNWCGTASIGRKR